MTADYNNSNCGEKEESFINFLIFYLSNLLKETLEHIFLVALAYCFVCLTIYHLMNTHLGIVLVRSFKIPKSERVLLVTAHPDDECMFFGPTILTLAKQKHCQIFLLCLSNGNFDQKGNVRKGELWNACRALRMRDENITLMNLTYLQDNPNLEWKTDTIAKYISKHVESLDINLLITFDRNGVSQHPNHSAIYYAVASLCLSGLLPKCCKILTLDSINLFRKYMSIFDLPISFMLATNWCILNWNERIIVQNAMKEHKSQMKWFRKLYIKFSRYILINSLHEMDLSDIELEMQIDDSIQ